MCPSLLRWPALLAASFVSAQQSPRAVAIADAWQLGSPVGGTLWPVSGVVTASQDAGSETVAVTIELSGLPPTTQHGFHIHANADLSSACVAAGAHFNPYGSAHGPRDAPEPRRHVGDLGNVVSDASGRVSATFLDSIISLGVGSAADSGVRSVAGRVVMVHGAPDDGGTGPNPPAGTSNTTGNAGVRMACALLVLQPAPSGGGPPAPQLTAGATAATAVLAALFLAAAAGVVYACCRKAPKGAGGVGGRSGAELSLGDAYASVDSAGVGVAEAVVEGGDLRVTVPDDADGRRLLTPGGV